MLNSCWRSKSIFGFGFFVWAIALIAALPFPAHAAGDLSDLYKALQSRGRAVTIPAKLLERLKLGSQDSNIPGKELVVTEADLDKHGITAFELGGVPTITMFHIETAKDDSWLVRFSLDGRVLNQEWEEGGYRTYEISSPQVAESEIGFWRQWLADGAKPSP